MHYFHVIATGNQDRPVFDDRDVRGDVFRGFEAVSGAACAIAAYTFMSSHMHSLIGLADPDRLPVVMKRLLGPPAQNLNRRMQQRGGIFQRSFWRMPADSAAYLMTLAMYIHANPAPNSTDLRRLDVGLRSSQAAWMSGAAQDWLQPGEVFDLFEGSYPATLQQYLEDRAALVVMQPQLDGRVDCVVVAVSRVCGTRPATLLDAERGGKRDRIVLAWALVREVGVAAASRVLAVTQQTVRRWSSVAEQDPAFQPAIVLLGAIIPK